MSEIKTVETNSPIKIINDLVLQEGVERADLAQFGFIDPEIIDSIPEEIAIKFKMIPFARDEDTLSVAMSNPFDIHAERALRMTAKVDPKIYYMPEPEMDEWLRKLYLQTSQAIEDLDEAQGGVEVEELGSDEEVTIEALQDQAREAPAIRHVNGFLLNAIQERASDVHIEPREKELKVRFRIDGVLRDVATLPKSQQAGIISRIKILSSLDIAERRVPQDGRTKLRIFGRGVDLRVSTIPTIYGEKVVLRVLDQDRHSLEIADLGLEASLQQGFKDILHQPHGMILVTGPTGSGKTTTLYSALNFINSSEKNIITVEDPVEYQLKGINQIQIKSDIGLTFSAGLRSILRQDPDVIMVGEIRDLETAEIAMRGALTGHLVFSTLHTNNSVATLMRLIEMGIDRYLICSSMHLILSQRLVRRICFHCAEPYEPENALLERLGEDRQLIDGITLDHGIGCSHCGGSGFWGRVALFEFFYLNSELRNMISDQVSADEIRARINQMGMETLLRNGLKKVHDGITTVDEVLKVAAENI